MSEALANLITESQSILKGIAVPKLHHNHEDFDANVLETCCKDIVQQHTHRFCCAEQKSQRMQKKRAAACSPSEKHFISVILEELGPPPGGAEKIEEEEEAGVGDSFTGMGLFLQPVTQRRGARGCLSSS
uniref:Uncharacterized protein n=1 Tax=Physcomitrium patens TaxID=3218 RepID=A0A7I4DUI0_PHYPA